MTLSRSKSSAGRNQTHSNALAIARWRNNKRLARNCHVSGEGDIIAELELEPVDQGGERDGDQLHRKAISLMSARGQLSKIEYRTGSEGWGKVLMYALFARTVPSPFPKDHKVSLGIDRV